MLLERRRQTSTRIGEGGRVGGTARLLRGVPVASIHAVVARRKSAFEIRVGDILTRSVNGGPQLCKVRCSQHSTAQYSTVLLSGRRRDSKRRPGSI